MRVREAWEEARARIELDGLLAVYSVERIGQVQLLYRARLLHADVAAGPESLEVRLVGWDEIPWDELAFPTVVGSRACAVLARPAGPMVTVGNPGGHQPGPMPGELQSRIDSGRLSDSGWSVHPVGHRSIWPLRDDDAGNPPCVTRPAAR